MKDKVCILLSYYLGEKYIDEQIDSIIFQDYPGEIEVIIRNDGPVDEGILKLSNKIMAVNRKLKIYNGNNVGPQRSFLDLIQKASAADFYFFSDQDDVWEKNKIDVAVNRLKDCTVPALWCSNYDLVDEKLNTIKKDCVKIVQRTFHFLYAQMFNTFPGCVMGFNRQLYLILKEMDLYNCMMHDSCCFATAIATGKVYYDNRSFILHRIHGENVVGTGFRKSTPIKWIKDKGSLLKNKEDYDLMEFGEKLLKTGCVKEKWENDVRLLSEYRRNTRNVMRLLFHKDVIKKIDPESASIHCKILFRLF